MYALGTDRLYPGPTFYVYTWTGVYPCTVISHNSFIQAAVGYTCGSQGPKYSCVCHCTAIYAYVHEPLKPFYCHCPSERNFPSCFGDIVMTGTGSKEQEVSVFLFCEVSLCCVLSFLRCVSDHNEDATIDVLQTWVEAVRPFYHSVVWTAQRMPR